MTRLAALILSLALFALACGGSSDADDGNAFGVPDCSEFVDGQPVPDLAMNPADGDGPNALCVDDDGEIQPSSVRNCDDGDTFIDAPHGFYFVSDGIWKSDQTGAWEGNHSATWRTAFDACHGN